MVIKELKEEFETLITAGAECDEIYYAAMEYHWARTVRGISGDAYNQEWDGDD